MALVDQTTEGRQAFATLFHSDGGNSLIQKFHTSCASFLTKKYRTHQWPLQGVPTQTAIERLAMTVTRMVRRPRRAKQSPQRTGGGPSTPARRAGEGSVCTYLSKDSSPARRADVEGIRHPGQRPSPSRMFVLDQTLIRRRGRGSASLDPPASSVVTTESSLPCWD